MTPTVRLATVADLDAIAQLEVELFPASPWSRWSLASLLDRADAHLAVAPAAGPALAYIALRRAADEAEVLRVGVHCAERRMGYGRALLMAGCAWSRSCGARRLFLEVGEQNSAAQALYEACGLARCGRRPDYYGAGLDALLFAVELRPERR